MKIRRPQGRVGSIPSARTTPSFQSGQDGAILVRLGLEPARFGQHYKALHTNVCSALRVSLSCDEPDEAVDLTDFPRFPCRIEEEILRASAHLSSQSLAMVASEHGYS